MIKMKLIRKSGVNGLTWFKTQIMLIWLFCIILIVPKLNMND